MFVGAASLQKLLPSLGQTTATLLLGVSPNMMNRLIDQHSCKDCNAIYSLPFLESFLPSSPFYPPREID
jgi:hypothetical protein